MIICAFVFIVAVFMIIYETKVPGRNWPIVRHWWQRACLLNGFQVGVVYLAGLTWDRFFLKWHHGFLSHLSPFFGGVLGYLFITFIFYWWHRWRHKSDFLWRFFHQLHHSPSRLEIATAFYKHPFELLADSFICSLILYPILGLSREAAANAVLLSGLAELFYHWNIKTPYWLGFIFQRPESHCIHHQDGVHSYNYSDLPLWDMLFGTFKNPKSWDGKCGLGEKQENRFMDMLKGIDVSKQ